MFHTSKIKEGADNSTYRERETFRLSLSLSLWLFAFYHVQLEPAEKYRVKCTRLPLARLILGVKFTMEELLHVKKV